MDRYKIIHNLPHLHPRLHLPPHCYLHRLCPHYVYLYFLLHFPFDCHLIDSKSRHRPEKKFESEIFELEIKFGIFYFLFLV